MCIKISLLLKCTFLFPSLHVFESSLTPLLYKPYECYLNQHPVQCGITVCVQYETVCQKLSSSMND